MIEKKTCLLLGAGASCHLGFPLGRTLVDSILNSLYDARASDNREYDNNIFLLKSDPWKFFDKLADRYWPSPDLFLEKNPEFMDLGKYLICKELVKHEKLKTLRLKSGWYNNLLKRVQEDTVDKFSQNNLSIVTFNYDRSLDWKLHRFVMTEFDKTSQEAWKILQDSIPIIHLHGELGHYPVNDYGQEGSLLIRSQDIKVISEVEDDLPEFDRASQLLKDAERVVVIGFGFGEENVRRLKYFNECESDDREIIIVSGDMLGNSRKQYVQWMAKWGMKENKHFWIYGTENMFTYEKDPFHWD